MGLLSVQFRKEFFLLGICLFGVRVMLLLEQDIDWESNYNYEIVILVS